MKDLPPRFIFSINPGRSGSHYLATLFDALPGVVGLHEPEPRCQREALAEFWQGKPKALGEKASDHMACLYAHREQTVVETSNAFIKGFGWLLDDWMTWHRIWKHEILVINLRRNRGDVIASLKRRNFLPRYETPAMAWMCCPFRTGDPDLDLNAYLDWVDALTVLWRNLHPDVRVIDVRLEDLQEIDPVCAFLGDCGLVVNAQDRKVLERIVGCPTNA